MDLMCTAAFVTFGANLFPISDEHKFVNILNKNIFFSQRK